LIFHINAVTLDDLQNYFEVKIDKGLEGIEAIKPMGACYIEFAHDNNSRWGVLFEYHRPLDSELPQWIRGQACILVLLALLSSTYSICHVIISVFPHNSLNCVCIQSLPYLLKKIFSPHIPS